MEVDGNAGLLVYPSLIHWSTSPTESVEVDGNAALLVYPSLIHCYTRPTESEEIDGNSCAFPAAQSHQRLPWPLSRAQFCSQTNTNASTPTL